MLLANPRVEVYDGANGRVREVPSSCVRAHGGAFELVRAPVGRLLTREGDGMTANRYDEAVDGMYAGIRSDVGGEGSRGGVVVGRTSGGKPIYKSHSHPDHKEFDRGEHEDAARLHEFKVRTLRVQRTAKVILLESQGRATPAQQRIKERLAFHGEQASKHRESMQ